MVSVPHPILVYSTVVQMLTCLQTFCGHMYVPFSRKLKHSEQAGKTGSCTRGLCPPTEPVVPSSPVSDVGQTRPSMPLHDFYCYYLTLQAYKLTHVTANYRQTNPDSPV